MRNTKEEGIEDKTRLRGSGDADAEGKAGKRETSLANQGGWRRMKCREEMEQDETEEVEMAMEEGKPGQQERA